MSLCDSHRAYRSRKQAKQQLRWHRAVFKSACLKCLMGRTLSMFPCWRGNHWHVGHSGF